LLPQVEDLSLSSGLRATQPRQQRRKKSQNMDHSAKSISDWKAVDRLDKFFSSHRVSIYADPDEQRFVDRFTRLCGADILNPPSLNARRARRVQNDGSSRTS